MDIEMTAEEWAEIVADAHAEAWADVSATLERDGMLRGKSCG